MVQGVLSSLLGSLGARAGSSESIAAFIQRLSGSSNIFEPGADGALGEQNMGCESLGEQKPREAVAVFLHWEGGLAEGAKRGGEGVARAASP